MELFMFGDPRLIAGFGGTLGESRGSYEHQIKGAAANTGHTSATLNAIRPIKATDIRSSFSAASNAGESLHKGKGSYHATPTYNNFLVDGQWPSAGIELETIATNTTSAHADALIDDLRSNWFHFERDGSLDSEHNGEYGFELITEPLPPRVYRDPRTWIGLENIISPWLESFDHDDTGLHVHVGLDQFQAFDSIPIKNKTSRMYIGKVMSLLVYYAIADASFIDRVVLRRNTRYCSALGERMTFDGASRLATGEMTGYEFIDFATSKLLSQNVSGWGSNVCRSYESLGSATHAPFAQYSLAGSTSHGTEVNTEHKYTIEFRRPKGTIHSLSIHRIVEFMTMIVRYACKCCRNPEEKVGTKQLYEFIHDNTTSVALKHLIEKNVA